MPLRRKKQRQEMCRLTFDNHSKTGGVKAWLSLFRPPNLLTVPGDPLVGAMLSAGTLGVVPSGTEVFATMGAALCLYAGGLLANDFFDRHVDARERPNRPIPSSAVNAMSVLVMAILLTGAGLLVAAQAGRAAFLTACLLATTSWFYNAIGKKMVCLAPANMGLCRGLSLLMGASVMGFSILSAPPILIATALIFSYIALVTIAARHEASPNAKTVGEDAVPGVRNLVQQEPTQTPAWVSWALPVIVVIGLLALMIVRWKGSVPALCFSVSGLTLGLAGMAVVWAIVWSIQLYRAASPREIQQSIGGLIRGLLLIQAAVCASSGPIGEGLSLLLLVAFPVSGWLGKWFHGS